MTEPPIDILLVEEDPNDAHLTLQALRAARRLCRVKRMATRQEALALLQRQTPYQKAPRPRLILLDLNLPGNDGWELLADIKSDDALRPIPVVVLSASLAEADIRRAYSLKANCYVSKPQGRESFLQVLQAIEAFWITTASLPQS